MNSRLILILDQQGAKRFDSEKIRSAFSEMTNVTGWDEGCDTIHSNSLLFQSKINRNNQEALIHLQADLMSIMIDGDTDLCCQIAIELQSLYETELYIYAEESLPEVVSLQAVSTTEGIISLLKLRG